MASGESRMLVSTISLGSRGLFHAEKAVEAIDAKPMPFEMRSADCEPRGCRGHLFEDVCRSEFQTHLPSRTDGVSRICD